MNNNQNKYYHIQKKSKGKNHKKIFLLSALRIPYLLLRRYGPDNRCRFTEDYPCLNRLYNYLLKELGKQLKLPVKRCELCGIFYLPDYRSKNHQKYCPYGCVEINRRMNKRRAKSRYRKKMQGLLKASEHNGRYRERKQKGIVSAVPETNYNSEEVERKLTSQIKYIYKRLNPGLGTAKLEQLDRVLKKLSRRISAP